MAVAAFRHATIPAMRSPVAARYLSALAILLAALPAASAWAGSGYTACLQPLGRHDPALLGPIIRGLGQAYGFAVRVLPPRPLPAKAWYAPRSRYRAQLLLDHLRADILPATRGCDAMLGFTGVDVSMSKGAHADWGVMGLAYPRYRVAVVSSFRLRRDADSRRVTERAVKVVIHELGHVLGLPHRSDGPECVMNDAAGSVRTIDRARGHLCAPERAAAEALLGRRLPQRTQLDWDAILREP